MANGAFFITLTLPIPFTGKTTMTKQHPMNNHHTEKLLKLVQKGHKPCIDSRTAQTGDLFFALPGENTHGNRFAAKALKNGCTLAIVDDPATAKDTNCLLVDDVLETLQQLSQAYRQTLDIPVIGITGSNGKTTTKELMHAVLDQNYHTFATDGNLNNHIGLPVSLLSIKKNHEVAIIEMGANQKDEIGHLCKLALPTHGLITNIGKAHLEGFGTIEDVARTKFALYNHVIETRGQLFINVDDPRTRQYADQPGMISYGSKDNAYCQGEIIAASPMLQMRFHVNQDFGKAQRGMEGTIQTQLTGAYNLENVLAAVTTGLFFGVTPQQATAAIKAYQPQNHRSQLIQTPYNLVVMDAYNANPTSMAAALENFSKMEGKPKAVMLGDMLELGKKATHEHQEVLSQLESLPVETIILVGDHFMEVTEEDSDTKVFPDVQKAGDYLARNPLTGYQVLVKGSRGIEMEKLLRWL